MFLTLGIHGPGLIPELIGKGEGRIRGVVEIRHISRHQVIVEVHCDARGARGENEVDEKWGGTRGEY